VAARRAVKDVFETGSHGVPAPTVQTEMIQIAWICYI